MSVYVEAPVTTDDPPLGSVWMVCCGVWEEDENAVDWRSLTDSGYQHWSSAECRR